jgi:hypothetical protein
MMEDQRSADGSRRTIIARREGLAKEVVGLLFSRAGRSRPWRACRTCPILSVELLPKDRKIGPYNLFAGNGISKLLTIVIMIDADERSDNNR